MGFFNILKVSGSALTAERLRLDVIAENIANAETTRTPQGGPYRRQMVIFEQISQSPFMQMLARLLGRKVEVSQGVKVKAVVADPRPFKLKFDPGHSDANAEGYVELPNVELVAEMVDMISATRAYEANVAVIQATKTMAAQALEIGR